MLVITHPAWCSDGGGVFRRYDAGFDVVTRDRVVCQQDRIVLHSGDGGQLRFRGGPRLWDQHCDVRHPCIDFIFSDWVGGRYGVRVLRSRNEPVRVDVLDGHDEDSDLQSSANVGIAAPIANALYNGPKLVTGDRLECDPA